MIVTEDKRKDAKKSDKDDQKKKEEGGSSFDSNWVTALIAILYVAALTSRYFIIDFTNQIEVETENGDVVKFIHPVFQTIAGYVGEFIFCTFFFLVKGIYKFKGWKSTDIRLWNFLLPAAFDFCENIALVLGLS